jgi:hypothetical protein
VGQNEVTTVRATAQLLDEELGPSGVDQVGLDNIWIGSKQAQERAHRAQLVLESQQLLLDLRGERYVRPRGTGTIVAVATGTD